MALGLAVSVVLTACANPETAAPRCEPDQRLGVVAQSVRDAAYVPCVTELAPGWHVEKFEVDDGGATLTLRSDRARRPVRVRFGPTCDVGGATPIAPRDEGVRTYVQVLGIEADYAGRMLDVFPGGCVQYEFAFERGPHIALTDELTAIVDLFPRKELRRALRADLGLTLDP